MTQPLSVFWKAKAQSRKLAMVSLYDAPSAALACEAGVDALLVGDSLGNVVLGHSSTLPVTMADMLRHTGAVVRGVVQSGRSDVPVVADLPFGSYSDERIAAQNAVALLQEGAHAVKLEGCFPQLARHLNSLGIPVMAHLGYTPQSSLVHRHVVQGRDGDGATILIKSAAAMDGAGCFGMVLEAVAEEVAAEIAENSVGSVIGIGAGANCDGQVLVFHDLVGVSEGNFKFVKRYANTRESWQAALGEYVTEVRSKVFPAPAHSWSTAAGESE